MQGINRVKEGKIYAISPLNEKNGKNRSVE